MIQLRKQSILDVAITNNPAYEILEYIKESLADTHEKYYIVTPNPEILVYASRHKTYREVLNRARIAIPDGIGVMVAGWLLGSPFQKRIIGVDLMERICQMAAEVNRKNARKVVNIGFLGGKAGIAERVAKRLNSRYPGLGVSYAQNEWKEEDQAKNDPSGSGIKMPTAENRELSGNEMIEIDILFIAFGFPKQEDWIAKHLSTIPVRIAMGVGGAFDYISGNVNRAPKPIRRLGLEWLYRLIHEPWRWRRQLALFKFGYLVLLERFSLYKNK